MIEHIVPSDRDIVKKLLIDHSVTYEPLKFKTQLNEFLPIMEFQAYFLYLENSIEILCLEESIDAQMIQKAMIGEDLLLTINNYIDLEKRLHNAKKCELITDFLYSIRDFVQ